MTSLTQICTVYDPKPFKHSKGAYGQEHVWRLERMVAEYVSVPYKFNVIESDKPGWWGKIDLFKKPGRIFYMDLSVAIIGNIDRLIQEIGAFTACRDFVSPDTLNSKVMSWDGDYTHVYKKFKKHHVDEYTSAGKWGDQAFIDHNVGDRRYFQDLFPNSVVSYKLGKVSDDTRIIGFHGKPKPEDTEYW